MPPPRAPAITPEHFTTFGELLKFLRRRAGQTQRELSIALGYSTSQISRLEQNERPPDGANIAARFVPALRLEEEPAWAMRLLELASAARADGERPEHEPDDEAASVPRRLPVQLTSFVGRVLEIAEVRRLMANGRLVTLTGPGGAGKTRLALQVAGEMLTEFQGEVWLTEFAPLADATLVPQAVAAVLGAHEQPGRSLTETLSNLLESRQALLIFDNCEHLVAACARLAEALLKACPNLRILGTSRETLNLAGETVWIVPALSLPDPQPWRGPASTQESLSVFQQSEAIRLFVERATAASPDFRLTSENGPWVAEICRRLEGMPLAIELAAARVRALSVQQIAERLENRFHLLASGSRSAPLRQQSLQATLDWSYALLAPSEQKVLQRLSVFAGSWTLEAAEAVCPGDGVAPDEVLNLLSQLVDKSLVQTDPAAVATRYRLLETVRQYTALRLAEAGDEAAWRDRQLNYFVDWAERVERRRADIFAWSSSLEAEHDNLRAALAWSLESEHNAGKGLWLAGLMGDFWNMRGYRSEGRLRLTAALAQSGADQPENNVARARALSSATNLAVLRSDYAAARALVQTSLVLCQQIGPAGDYWLASARQQLGDVAMEEGHYPAALASYQEALTIFQQLRETPAALEVLMMMGWVHMRAGDYQPAAETLDQALNQSRGLGDRWLIAQALAGRGELAVRQGQYSQAVALLEKSLELRRAMGNLWGMAISLGSLGWLALRQHDFTRMRQRLCESLTIRLQLADVGGGAWCLEKLAEADLLRGQAAPAARRLGYLQRAARVFGAATALRARLNAVMDGADQPEFERHQAELRTALGEDAFNAARAEGGAMTLERAAEYALAETESPAEDEPLVANEQAQSNFGGLTARERQTAALIAQGQSNRQIAEAMVVGVRTVETYVSRILSKLALDSRVQIATWAIEKGLAPPARER